MIAHLTEIAAGLAGLAALLTALWFRARKSAKKDVELEGWRKAEKANEKRKNLENDGPDSARERLRERWSRRG